MKFAILLFALSAVLPAQTPVTITVDAAQTLGTFPPIYRFFGYDEPNYTYAPNGRKLVGELAAISSAPAYLRTHFLLATGDGAPNFKWGSTNAYTVWKRMGSPSAPSAEQTAELAAAGQLQTLGSPRWIANPAGTVEVKFSLPRQAVSLLEFSW